MGGGKKGSSGMDRMKRRLAVPVWKPVSTSSRCSSTMSAGNVEHDNQIETLEEQPSVSVACEMETLSESGVGSGTSEVLHQEIVIEEPPHDLGSEKSAEITTGAEKHSISVQVDASLIRFVKGKGGSTQRQIEEETKVKIIFPTSKEESFIVIEGASIESVTKASKKIELAVEQAVKSPSLDYSHFVSLPLAIHPDLIEKLYNFQNSILGDTAGNRESESDEDAPDVKDEEGRQLESSDVAVKLEVQDDEEHVQVKIGTPDHSYQETHVEGTSQLKRVSYPIRKNASRAQTINEDLGIDKSIFIKPKTFHLTVLMLKLWNKERLAAATEVFQGISTEVLDALDNRPVYIRLKGLECMRGSPAKAHVLYAPVEEIGGEGRLLRACQVITQAYVKAGLVLEKDARQPLKLHATLMNARHRRKRKHRNRKPESFDAQSIFTRFGSEEWGDYPIREAHLSQRFVFDESGYYHCCASIAFPESMQVE